LKSYKCTLLCCCYNRKKTTTNFISSLRSSLRELDYIEFNILLLDDGDDNTGEYLKKNFSDLKMEVYKGDGTFFWNGGMRYLMENLNVSVIDFFIFLNDDIVLKKDAIKSLFSTYSFSKQTKKVISGKFISKISNKFTYGIRNKNYQEINKNEESFFLNGNLVLFPISVIKDIGLLSDRYGHSLGDWDYGLRLKAKGYSLIMTDKASGFCEPNSTLNWFNPSKTILERINSFYKTKKMSLKEHYHFNKIHFGLFFAVKSSIAILTNIISPSLYKLIKKHESSNSSRRTRNKDK